MSAAEALSGPITPADPTAPQPRGFGSWWRLYASELRLILSRRRNQAGLLVLAGVPIMIAVSTKYWGSDRHGGGEGGGPDFISQILGNGIFVAWAALTIEITMFLPLALAMLSGDAVAGEAHTGTLRYLLTVPVARARLLAVKLAALVTCAVVGAVTVALTGVLIGTALFGAGPVLTLSGSTISFADGLWRLVLATLYVAAGLSALAAIGLFVSTLTEQPIAVMVIVMIINIVTWILDALPQLDWLHPWLLVHRWPAFSELLRQPPAYDTMLVGLGVDAAYFVVFGLLAWARFAGKDITS